VNYLQNKVAIDRLTTIIDSAETFGFAAIFILAFASILITFNTIRLAIYTARDEISVMQLVGASHMYVRGPFVISGILYGFTAGLLVLIILYPLSLYLAEPSEKFFGNFNTFEYFTSHFTLLFVTVIGTGILLGATSSYLAVHRYLRN